MNCQCGKKATIEQLDIFGCSVGYCVGCYRAEGAAEHGERSSDLYEGLQVSALCDGPTKSGSGSLGDAQSLSSYVSLFE